MANKIIEAENLTKVYKGKVKAVDSISFSVDEGEIFGFLGPNGAGKTTTIKMLNTVASITSGKATVAGQDVSKHPAAVRDSIGVVPQELTADDELNGMENIMLSARLHHVRGADARNKAADLLKLVDLDGAANRRVKTYSGGMRRRLQLAIGLVHTPKILFLDEPTIGLDVQTRTKMWEYLRTLNKEQGLTIFMTTHYLEEADGLCDRVAIIDHGTIKVAGSPAKLKESVGGDVLTLELADGPDISDFLRGLPDVSSVVTRDHSYRIKLPSTERALPAIVDGVSKKGLEIKNISFTKPTLDQVFLEITGKSMRDEQEGGAGESWVQNVMTERMK
ncbi:MAG TPA: ATP-binding cassette domain-containing protein [Nitrososphaerales archaeon]|nr:ATP-binding cassette domain-containing protein [Nitrososphaerales archaeon]